MNIVVTLFVLLSSMKIVAIKIIDVSDVTSTSWSLNTHDRAEDEISLDTETVIPFKHPYFVAVLGYFGEFLCVAVIYIYYTLKAPNMIPSTNLSMITMLWPALCDFLENLLLIFALTQIYPSLSVMSRAFILPLTAILSKIVLKKVFSIKQIVAIICVAMGVVLACVVQFMGEQEEENKDYSASIVGFVLLLCSAMLQATEIVLEE